MPSQCILGNFREHLDRLPVALRVLVLALLVTAYELVSGLLAS
jgi:hypothetical protein